jgi:hypothetical protein
MHHQAILKFIERRITLVSSLVIFGVLLLYFLSQFISPLREWIVTGGFFSIIVIIVLFEILRRVVDMKVSDPSITVYAHQDETWEEVYRFIDAVHPTTADLLEISTSTIGPLLEKLRDGNVRIRLLMCNPASAPSELQKGVIETFLRIRTNVTFADYEHVDIRLYSVPPSVRGRRLGGQLTCVGWYSYLSGSDEVQLHGHDNAMVVTDEEGKGGRALARMFNRTFESLWESSSTVKVFSHELLGSARVAGGQTAVGSPP